MIHTYITVFPGQKIVSGISGPFTVVFGNTPRLEIALGNSPGRDISYREFSGEEG